ncbi:MAG: lipoate--protein ligase [Spirochaetaceae bacterium]|nr:lipoate--protein ligase [Spirochaetaceae bacterium]
MKNNNLTKIKYYESTVFDPYLNLAMEEKLMDSYEKGTLVFYLWQNKKTVVIGRNQCAKDECNLSLMQENDVKLARRSSGGGAVYHDIGNLNFTFITDIQNFDTKSQLNIITETLNSFGLDCYFSGRNDLLIDEYKISGQAYLKAKDLILHHGTLIVDVNIDDLGKYLKKDCDKLKIHGVQSHSQRVRNIKDFNNDLTVETIKIALKGNIAKIYNLPLVECELIKADVNKYSSDKWLYRICSNGKRIKRRFSYGLIDLNFELKNNVIVSIIINSDLMDVLLIEEIKDQLIGRKFDANLVDSFHLSNEKVASDIRVLIGENILCLT